ncbi:unnamed protein product [Callosobruchus maculatus]|uniref:chitin synthase n=1 Tax=Callosobruchus maculatus TaxID=64391 RepID=A0A653CMA0_CALMS|nr:unnamed protein product [Callosobruchus maculatus]
MRDEYDEVLLGEDKGEEKEQWNLFKNIPRKTESGSAAESKLLHLGIKCLKLATVIITFTVVLSTAVVSKSTLLFMVSQVRLNTSRAYCNKGFGVDDRQQFFVTLPPEETTVWIWMIMFSYWVPEIGTFIRSLRICCFKHWEYPDGVEEFLRLCFVECLPAIGSAILVFVVFPELDVIKAAMLTNAVCFIPAVLLLFSKKTHQLSIILDIFAIVAQASAAIAWPILEQKTELYLIPFAVFCISIGWVKNYMPQDCSLFCGWKKKKSDIDEDDEMADERENLKKKLLDRKKKTENDMYFMYLIIAPIKCVVFFVVAVLAIWVKEGDGTFIFDMFDDAFQSHKLVVNETIPPMLRTSSIDYNDAIPTGLERIRLTSVWVPITVFLINISSTYICYAFGKFACKIMVQMYCFAFPINLTVPVLVTALIAVVGNYYEDVCAYSDIMPRYLFFNVPPLTKVQDFLLQEHSWVWLMWLFSQTWITFHIWSNRDRKLSSTEVLFFKPLYDAFFIEQSLAMNRRRIPAGERHEESTVVVDDEAVVKVYACGTMWHEDKEEMVMFLKSILRMDEDQCAYRMIKEYHNVQLPEYYEFEAHILFDDAFVRKKKDPEPRLNEHVQRLIESVQDAASDAHATNVKIKPPIIMQTPYGGRIVWTLPGRNKIVAHLKDSDRIRTRKRWSQVMYMYYLLGYRIMDNDELTESQIASIAGNTYILALDGDIDFQPHAVQLLLDYMKKNRGLGAACGRIHPVGAGAMAWYQIFEYAVGHWLQKATEHVIGCVLCSPGCFSLFRASALMDVNVMAKYTTESEEAKHFVQYDQGEDRWLCTLLLQRGYRVEYSAASDAYTKCPEGFNEFYNQRRRWMPSTTANILDLLNDRDHIVKVNDNISWLYIIYQMILMVGTVLGPGTIFLMLVGAFVSAFKLSQWESFAWNLLPILVFVIICAICKPNTQLFFASIISAIYGLIMMAVLVGILMQIKDDGVMAPSSLFFFFVALEFIITALLHPQEFYCLKYGVIYYVTVPSMYMLLVIYSVFNMNSVSWGTRDTTVVDDDPPENADKDKDKKDTTGAKVKKHLNKFQAFFRSCFECLYWRERELLQNIQQKLDTIERNQYNLDSPVEMRRPTKRPSAVPEGTKGPRSSLRSSNAPAVKSLSDFKEYEEDGSSEYAASVVNIPEDSWMDYFDGTAPERCAETWVLEKKEEDFWKGLIKTYLYPIDGNTVKQKAIGLKLKDLRDKVVMSFFMLNSLFVLTVFMLTVQKNVLHIDWPFNPKVNFTYRLDTNEFTIHQDFLQLEPIGFIFLIFFFMLMGIQFFGMVQHRFGTYCQIMANTYLNLIPTRSRSLKEIGKNELRDPKLFKKLIRLQGINDDEEEDADESANVKARKTAAVLAMKRGKKKRPTIYYLDEAFDKRIQNFKEGNFTEDIGVPRKTLHNLVGPQSSQHANHRNGGASSALQEDTAL